MEQHPIPQQISTYQFRLVGDMTLKQFFELASGIGIGLLIYSTNLHPFFKWPLVGFFILFGVALAFIPLEERPLEKWIIAFFRSIYSPTLYFWKKPQRPDVFFAPETQTAPTPQVIAPHGKEVLDNYLANIQHPTEQVQSSLDVSEKSFLAGVSGLLGEVPEKTEFFVPATSSRSKINIPQVPAAVNFIKKPQENARATVQTVTLPTPLPQVKTGGVYQNVPKRVEEKLSPGQKPQFQVQATPPSDPQNPNTVSGQIMDATGKIVEGAILEIKDSAGRPVRALRSNKLGHFLTVTPLQEGKYQIVLDKEGYQFDPLDFEAKGKIIPPIMIRARQ